MFWRWHNSYGTSAQEPNKVSSGYTALNSYKNIPIKILNPITGHLIICILIYIYCACYEWNIFYAYFMAL